MSDDFWGDPVHSYSRAQAIADGVLVDVTATAREAGITYPVALTSAAWADCVQWSRSDTERTGWPQNESGRLWDVVWMLRAAIRRQPNENPLLYKLYRVPLDVPKRFVAQEKAAQLVTLKAVCGPGDTPAPVITIMLPNED